MTDTPAHTPLPWVIDKYGSVTHGRECVSANGFSMVMSPGDGQNEAKANADFIVRACNSHYQLVSALESANTLLTKAVGDIVAYRIMAGKRSSKSATAEYVEAINAIDATLSQAGGASE